MSKLTMIIGVPGSGKSTLAREIQQKTGAIILSSDKLREELLGDESNQCDNAAIFQELNLRTRKALNAGLDVIYDATNTNKKKRTAFLSTLGKDVYKEALAIVVPFGMAISNDQKRKRTVGADVISKFAKSYSIPQFYEGWDEISFNEIPPVEWERIPLSGLTFSEFKMLLHKLGLGDMVNSPQNNPHHSFSIDRHTYKFYEFVDRNYEGSDKDMLLLASIFHDSGKTFCRETNPETLYDSFYGHEKISAQIAVMRMQLMGYDKHEILMVADLIQNHMLFLDDGAYEKEKKIMIDPYRFKLLELLRKADLKAK